MKRILVTGGAGFIGSHLTDRLLSENWQVTVLDNFDPFYARRTKLLNIERHRSNPCFDLVELDIRDGDSLRRQLQFRDYDVIVHLAAKAGVRPSICDPTSYQEVNVGGTQSLLEFAKERKIKQFVFASSSSVYGVNKNVPWSESDYALMPISPYASSKVSGELLGHVYSHLYGLRFLALRFFTVYGPRQRPDLAIHRFARLLQSDKPLPIFGQGTMMRDYTYVEDIVNGVCAAIEYDESRYEVINLGNHYAVSLLRMVEALAETMKVKAKLNFMEAPAGDVPFTFADIGKAQKLLGYQPQTSFEDGIRLFVQWFTTEGSTSHELPKESEPGKMAKIAGV
jgi:UDP-glucuronate 4-epimerase